MELQQKYDNLQQNTLFSTHLPGAIYIDFKELDLDSSNSTNDQVTSEKKPVESDLIVKLGKVLDLQEIYVQKILKKCEQLEKDEQNEKSEKENFSHLKNIKTYKALQQYSTLNTKAMKKLILEQQEQQQQNQNKQQQQTFRLLLDSNDRSGYEIITQKQIKYKLRLAQQEEDEIQDKEHFILLQQDIQVLLKEEGEENVFQDTWELKDKEQHPIEGQDKLKQKNQHKHHHKHHHHHQLHNGEEEDIDDASSVSSVDSQGNELNQDKKQSQQLQQKNQGNKQSIKRNCFGSLVHYYHKNYKMIEMMSGFILIMLLPVLIAPFLLEDDISVIKIILIISIPLSFFLGCAIGGNDICNAMGTCYGSKTMTMGQVIWWGIVFEVAGALLLGGSVSKTISRDIVDAEAYEGQANLFALCMPAVLAGAGFSCVACTIYGIPVSITQGVIFGLTAVGLASVGSSGVSTDGLVKVIVALLTSPLIGSLIALLLYLLIIKGIKNQPNPYIRAQQWMPVLGFFSIFLVMFMVLLKGFHIEEEWVCAVISAACGIVTAIGLIINQKIRNKNQKKIEEMTKEERTENSIEIFKPLLVMAALCVAFAHGANDVGSCVGPLIAVINVYNKGEEGLGNEVDIPFYSLAIGAAAFAAGTLGMGGRTIKTIGNDVTTLDPMKSFTIQASAAAAILISTVAGMPVSTSHCTVGAVLGATYAEKLLKTPYKFNFSVLKKVFASWIYTIPMVFILAVYFYYSIKGVLW